MNWTRKGRGGRKITMERTRKNCERIQFDNEWALFFNSTPIWDLQPLFPTVAVKLHVRCLFLFWGLTPDIEDINHRQDFRNGTFVTLKRKYFSKPLHSECNWTNQIACFDQPLKSDQSDCLFCRHSEHFGWHKPCCFMISIFLSGWHIRSDGIHKVPLSRFLGGNKATVSILQHSIYLIISTWKTI